MGVSEKEGITSGFWRQVHLYTDMLAGLARKLLALVLGHVFPPSPGNLLQLGAGFPTSPDTYCWEATSKPLPTQRPSSGSCLVSLPTPVLYH